jgi:hypothetical protein
MKKNLFIFSIAVLLIIATAATNEAQKSFATVNQSNGLFMFTDSKPNNDYTFLGQVDSKKFRPRVNPQYQLVRDYLLKEAKKKYPEADGIIFHFSAGDTDKADVIKFK